MKVKISGLKLANFTKVSACSALLILLHTVANAQIVPDGSTQTQVGFGDNGQPSVIIAPSDHSGISHNRFSDFSVGREGVLIDNRVEAANTILNEVTSSRPSTLAGPTVIQGAQAHFILANPNGISVDGARFENSGGVVLSTGRPTFVQRQSTGGRIQTNIILETRDGKIDVSGQGLGGAMTSLQLLAKKIRIDGPVENKSNNSRSAIGLSAGASNVEFDSSIIADSNLEDWGRLKTIEGSGEPDAISITERGSLSANNIRISATDRGAGVSFAGEGLASLGDFAIGADGHIGTSGSVKAARSVKIVGASVKAISPEGGKQQSIEAVDGALTILARSGSIQNTGVLMRATKREPDDEDSKGAVTLAAAQDISLLTDNAHQLAVVFGDKDIVAATAGRNISNNTGRFLSNSETHLTAGQTIENIADIVGGTGEWRYREDVGDRLWYTLWLQRQKSQTISLDHGAARVPGQQAYIVGSAVHLSAPQQITNRGSFMNANVGDINIRTARFENSASLSGTVEYSQTCGLTCVSYGVSTAVSNGGVLNAAGKIDIESSERISNLGGQFLSYQNVALKSPLVELEPVSLPSVLKRPPGLYNFWSGSSAWIGTTLTGGLILAPIGSVEIQSFKPVTANAGMLQAASGLFVPAGVDYVSRPEFSYPYDKKSIGLYRKLTGG